VPPASKSQLRWKHHHELEQFADEFGSPFRNDPLDHDEQQKLFETRLKPGMRLVTKQKIEQEVFQQDRAITRRGLERWVIAGAVAAEPAMTDDGVESTSQAKIIAGLEPAAEQQSEVTVSDREPELAPLDDLIGSIATTEPEVYQVAPESESASLGIATTEPEVDQVAEPEAEPIGDLIGSLLQTESEAE
jgi:hypothetical protein